MAVARKITRPYREERSYLRVEGDSVRVVTEVTERVVKLSDFLAQAGNQAGLMTPVLPNGCRYFRQKGDITIYVIEKPPQVRQITWHGMDRDVKKLQWRLAFPFTIFVIQFVGEAISERSRLYYRKSPIIKLEDELFHANVSNVYWNTDRICTGYGEGMKVTGSTAVEKAESFIMTFWQSKFNTDLLDNFNRDAENNPQIKTLEAWQTASKENPFFPMDIPWRKACTIAELTESMITRGI